jgi:hypothetical protein
MASQQFGTKHRTQRSERALITIWQQLFNLAQNKEISQSNNTVQYICLGYKLCYHGVDRGKQDSHGTKESNTRRIGNDDFFPSNPTLEHKAACNLASRIIRCNSCRRSRRGCLFICNY